MCFAHQPALFELEATHRGSLILPLLFLGNWGRKAVGTQVDVEER